MVRFIEPCILLSFNNPKHTGRRRSAPFYTFRRKPRLPSPALQDCIQYASRHGLEVPDRCVAPQRLYAKRRQYPVPWVRLLLQLWFARLSPSHRASLTRAHTRTRTQQAAALLPLLGCAMGLTAAVVAGVILFAVASKPTRPPHARGLRLAEGVRAARVAASRKPRIIMFRQWCLSTGNPGYMTTDTAAKFLAHCLSCPIAQASWSVAVGLGVAQCGAAPPQHLPLPERDRLVRTGARCIPRGYGPDGSGRQRSEPSDAIPL